MKWEEIINESSMNRAKAIKMDKNKDGKIEVYSDEDDDEIPTMFGINSGFAYAQPSNEKRWIKDNPEFKVEYK